MVPTWRKNLSEKSAGITGQFPEMPRDARPRGKGGLWDEQEVGAVPVNGPREAKPEAVCQSVERAGRRPSSGQTQKPRLASRSSTCSWLATTSVRPSGLTTGPFKACSTLWTWSSGTT